MDDETIRKYIDELVDDGMFILDGEIIKLKSINYAEINVFEKVKELTSYESEEIDAKAATIYFYIDEIAVNQLFEQTPEGDIIEIVREAGTKIGRKGSIEFGNDLISKLSMELSSELAQKTIVKTQVTTIKKIATIEL